MRKFKTLITPLLVAACATCLCVAFAACKGNKEEAASYGYGEEGWYYYDASVGTEYLMSLQGGTYMIAESSAKGYSGKYSYDVDGNTVSFRADEGDDFAATFSDGAMQLAISGTPYTFLKKIDYTVTFVDGNDKITQSVTYGKAATSPDTEKSGYIFLGWYEDASFSTPYKFNTAVTGDLTLYACYIVEDTSIPNFEVRFIDTDGSVIGTVTTKNGMVLDADIPEVEGILGWWVSATNSADELTYKYDGRVLYEATNLYAVSSSALGASVYDDKVTWEISSSSVTITVDGEPVASGLIGTSYPYDFASLSVGAHEVEVGAQGYGTEKLVYVRNGLARVSNFSVYGTTLVYNRIENAEYYYVSVECGNASHSHDMVYNGNTLTYDFSGCEMGPDGIRFTVYACAPGYATSMSEVYVYALILGGTTVTVDAESDTASWTGVSGATGYEVYVNGEYADTVTGTEYSFKYEEKGTVISVAVRPVAPGYYSEISAEVSYEKATLRTPEIISISEYSITWDEITGAEKYELNINGYLITVEGATTYVLTETDKGYISDENTNAISVMAVTGTFSENSQYSDIMYVTNKEMNPALTYTDGVVTWQYALAAGEYVVDYEGEKTAIAGTNSFGITFTHSGDNVVKVYFVTGDGESAYAEMTIYAYAVIFDVGGISDGIDTIYVAKGDKVTLTEPQNITGRYTFGGWYTLPDTVNDPWADEYAAGGVLYTDGQIFDANGTIILYAYWITEKMSVSFDAGTGMLTDAAGNAIVNTGIPYGITDYTLSVPTTSDGKYAFYGWYANANGQGVKYTDEKGRGLVAFTEDATTVYAYWVEVLDFSVTTYGGETVYSVSAGPYINIVNEITVPAEYDGYKIAVAGSTAFKNQTSLEVINLPDTMMYIATTGNGYTSGTGAFAGCSNLREVNIYETGDEPDTTKIVNYYSADGILYYYNELNGYVELIYYPYAKDDAVFVMTDHVSNEYEYVMDENTNVTHVVRPVTSIPTQVFYNNFKLVSVVLPATLENIETKVFYQCNNLVSVSFAEDVTTAEVAVAESLTIAEKAFQNCSRLETVTLPVYVTDFDVNSFNSCTAIENVYTVGSDGNYRSIDGILYTDDGATLVFCPRGRQGAVKIETGAVAIGASAFAGCTQITSVVIPAQITLIGESAFEGCTGLASLSFQGDGDSGKLTMETRAFYGCSSLTTVVLPENLQTLGEYAFGNCRQLASVTLNSWAGATSNDLQFSDNVFTDTSGVSHLKSLTLGANLPMIDINTVIGGTSLETVILEAGNTNYAVEDNVVFDYEMKTLVFFPATKGGQYTVPDGVQTLSGYVFRGRTNLTAVTVPTSVTYVGVGAFAEATSLVTVTFTEGGTESLVICYEAFSKCTALTTVTLPTRLEEVGDRAFYGCKALKEFTIPSGVERMGTYDGAGELSSMLVFDGCSALEKIGVADGNTAYTSIDGVLYALRDGSPDILLICPVNCAAPEDSDTGYRTITIPETVTAVWAKAFYGNSSVQYIAMAADENSTEPSGDETEKTAKTMKIQESAFQNCNALLGIDIPYGVKAIAANTFSGCILLSSVNIPNSVTSIAAGAFSGCKSLAEISFYGDGNEDLVIQDGSSNSGVFLELKFLKEVELPERTTTIGEYAFAGCSALTTINIPASVTKIGYRAFYECPNISGITFAEDGNLESIGEEAFAYSGVKEITTLPETLTSIGKNAFEYSTLEKIKLPASLTTIGTYSSSQTYGAFDYAYALSDVEFETGIQITFLAGFKNTAIEEIIIPASVEEIWDSTFQYCYKLKKVSFEDESHCVKFGNNSFTYCTALEEFSFPDLAADVASSASFNGISIGSTMFFTGCTSLKKIYISGDVTDLTGIFVNSTSSSKISDGLEIEISEENDCFWIDENNIIYKAWTDPSAEGDTPETAADTDKSTQNRVLYLALNEIAGAYTVANGVREIAPYAFAYQTSLTKVNVPSSVVTIGDYAFYNCTRLTEVTFGEESQLETLGKCIFNGCTALEGVSLPEGLTEIGEETFSGFTTLKTVALPSKLEKIAKSAFYNCQALTGITLPEGLKEIGESAFFQCYALTEITVPKSVATLGEKVFYSCNGLTKVTFAAAGAGTTEGGNATLTAIPANAFYGCEKLESIELPDTVLTIGESAFYNCKKLTAVSVPAGVAEIPSKAFYGCSVLAEVNLPSTVTSIGSSAFYNCSALKNIGNTESSQYCGTDGYFADLSGITSLGDSAFYSSGVENVIYPAITPTTASVSTFYSCKSLVSVTFTGNTKLGKAAFAACSALTTLNGLETYQISMDNGSGTGSSALGAFSNCTALTTVDLSRASAVGAYAFYGCTALAAVTLPGQAAIGKYAFYNCSSLKNINNDGSSAYYDENKNIADLSNATSVGDYAFYGSGVENVIYPAIAPSTASTNTFDSSKSLVSVKFTGTTKLGESAFANCTALKDIEGLSSQVTLTDGSATSGANMGAFEACTGLEYVVIGDMSVIAGYAFYGCTSLRSIAKTEEGLSDGYADLEGVTEIKLYAFYNCGALTSFNLENVTTVGNYAFANNTKLEYIELGSVTSAGTYIFSGCTSLKEAKIGGITTLTEYMFQNCSSLTGVTTSGITEIKQYCFSGCSSLTNIDLSDAETLGDRVFYNCTSLEMINAPHVSSLGKYAFYGCSKLETVTFGASTFTSVSDYAFQNCTSLTSIALPETVTEIGSYAFSGCSGLVTINLPDALTTIKGQAFEKCTSLETLYFGKNVTSLGGTVSYGDFNSSFLESGIKYIYVDEENPTYFDDEGVLYNKAGYVEFYPVGRTDEEYTVLEGMGVGQFAFYYAQVGKVVLSEGLTEISYGAFKYAEVNEMEIPSTVTTIGQYAFANTASLKNITLHEGLKTIDDNAFYRCSLESIDIPYTVEKIGENAFSGSTTYSQSSQGTKVTVSASVPLQYVKFDATDDEREEESMLTTIGQYAFRATKLVEVELPASLTAINSSVFLGCLQLTSVKFNAAPATLGSNMFMGDNKLTNVELSDDFRFLSSRMFDGCTSLTKIELPEGLTFLGSYTFCGCAFTEITIPEGVTHITAEEGKPTGSDSTYTFSYCQSLTKVTLPSGLQSIGGYAFQYCSSLETITYTGRDENEEGNTFPDSLYQISSYAFTNCTALKEITIPGTVSDIGSQAFRYCSGLETLVLGEGMSSLGKSTSVQYIFGGCTGLENVTIPESMTYIGQYAFQSDTKVGSIILGEGVYVDANAFNGWTSQQSIYVSCSEYHTGAWSSTWKNSCSANVYYYMPEPETKEGCLNFGLSYWYYAEDGKTIVTWSYDAKYAVGDLGEYVTYDTTTGKLLGMYLLDGSALRWYEIVSFATTDDQPNDGGRYLVYVTGDVPYIVTLSDLDMTATVGDYTGEFELTVTVNGGETTFRLTMSYTKDAFVSATIEGDTGSAGEFAVSCEKATKADEATGVGETYYLVTIEGDDAEYMLRVVLGEDGTASATLVEEDGGEKEEEGSGASNP